MARNHETNESSGSTWKRAAARVKRLFARGRSGSEARSASGGMDVEQRIEAQPEKGSNRALGSRRVTTDIPMDQIEREYLPTQTSLKASFRTDGADRERDQDYAIGFADDRWNEEDRLTNRSGDPRIGTHGRTYESRESRPSNNDE